MVNWVNRRMLVTIGAESLLNKFGSRLAIAEALLLGLVLSHEQRFVGELVDKITMEAAKFRVEKCLAAGTVKLTGDSILPS